YEESDEAAEDRHQDGFGQELTEDLGWRRADSLARSHFTYALVERGELDVHDHDPADQQRNDPADHERHVVHAVVLLVAAQIGHPRHHFVVLHPVLAEEHLADLIDRFFMLFDVAHARVHEADFASRQRLTLASKERGDGHVDLPVHPPHHVALVIEAEVLLLHHADYFVAGAVDGDDFPDRVVGGEELLRPVRAEDHHPRPGGQIVVGNESAACGVDVVHRRVGRRDAHHAPRLLHVAIADGHRLLRHRRHQIDFLRSALNG